MSIRLPKKATTCLAFSLALIFIALISIQAVNNADIWFHLKIGEYIVKNRILPQVDIMSHTAAGREWVVASWGYGIITYLLATQFGLQSLTFLRLIIAILLFLVLWKNSNLLGAKPMITAITSTAAFYVISIAWIDRPHLLGVLFVTCLMLILTLYQEGRTRAALFIPPLLFLWSNIHASLPLAVVIMVLLLGTKFLETLKKGRGTLGKLPPFNYQTLAVIIPVSFLLSALNPYHLNIYKYFFKINSIATENIFEWLPLPQFFADPYVRAFLIFLLVYAVTMVLVTFLNPPKVSYFEIGLFLILTYMAFSALRHMVIFVPIMTPFLAKNLTLLVEKIPSRGRGARLSYHIMNTLCLLGLLVISIPPARKVLASGLGLPETLLPVEAVDFVAKVKPNGQMYNHFNWGGYLLWRLYPEYQTFIDGRLDMFVPDIYKEWLAVGMSDRAWRQILEKYQVGWVIFPSEGIWEGLRDDLESNGDWCLIFWDDYATVVAKKDTNQSLCHEYAYTAITPFNASLPARQENQLQAEKEYQRAINSSPKNAAAYNKLGTLYLLTEEPEKAREEFLKAKEVNPRYAAPDYNLGCLEEEKNSSLAVTYFKSAINLNSDFAPAYKKLALIYGRRFGNVELAKKYLLKYERASADPQEKSWAQDEIYRLEHNIHLLDKL